MPSNEQLFRENLINGKDLEQRLQCFALQEESGTILGSHDMNRWTIHDISGLSEQDKNIITLHESFHDDQLLSTSSGIALIIWRRLAEIDTERRQVWENAYTSLFTNTVHSQETAACFFTTQIFHELDGKSQNLASWQIQRNSLDCRKILAIVQGELTQGVFPVAFVLGVMRACFQTSVLHSMKSFGLLETASTPLADKDKPDWRWENLRRHFHYHGGRKQLWQNLQESLSKDALAQAALKPLSLDQNDSEDQITDQLIQNIYSYCCEILARLGCETLSYDGHKEPIGAVLAALDTLPLSRPVPVLLRQMKEDDIKAYDLAQFDSEVCENVPTIEHPVYCEFEDLWELQKSCPLESLVVAEPVSTFVHRWPNLVSYLPQWQRENGFVVSVRQTNPEAIPSLSIAFPPDPQTLVSRLSAIWESQRIRLCLDETALIMEGFLKIWLPLFSFKPLVVRKQGGTFRLLELWANKDINNYEQYSVRLEYNNKVQSWWVGKDRKENILYIRACTITLQNALLEFSKNYLSASNIPLSDHPSPADLSQLQAIFSDLMRCEKIL